jgi:hypothetical protein
MKEYITSFIVACAVSFHGCGCNEENIAGDAGVDAMDLFEDPAELPTIDITGPEAPTVEDFAWDPPIENLGETGWRDSVEPLCPPTDGIYQGYDIWSDYRGVFAIIGMAVDGTDALNDIFYNDGSGWIAPYSDSGTASDYQSVVTMITGLPGRELFGWGMGHESFYIFGEAGSVEPVGAYISDAFVVNQRLAYATIRSDPRLLIFESSWGPYPGDPLPFEANRVWANNESIFCGGGSGIIMSTGGEGWIVHNTRSLSDVTAIWGFSADDVWVAGTDPAELLHFDGEDWSKIDWPSLSDPSENECGGSKDIIDFWGIDGYLFFHTGREFAMWDGTGFTILGYWPGTRDSTGIYCLGGLSIGGIWGNAPNEVFLAVTDPGHTSPECGQEYSLWWDGSEFHWF